MEENANGEAGKKRTEDEGAFPPGMFCPCILARGTWLEACRCGAFGNLFQDNLRGDRFAEMWGGLVVFLLRPRASFHPQPPPHPCDGIREMKRIGNSALRGNVRSGPGAERGLRKGAFLRVRYMLSCA